MLIAYCLLTLCCVFQKSHSYGCRWPCAFRNRPWYIGTDGLWFIDDNGCGTWNNVSRPKDNQYTTSECVERRGSFFVVREYDKFYCMKLEIISDDFYYGYLSKTEIPNYNPTMFCSLCEVNKMSGPLFSSSYQYHVSKMVVRPITCTTPIGCPIHDSNQITCPLHDQHLDNGKGCKKRFWRHHWYVRSQRWNGYPHARHRHFRGR